MNNRRHYTLPAAIPSPHVQLVYDGCREVTTPRSRRRLSHRYYSTAGSTMVEPFEIPQPVKNLTTKKRAIRLAYFLWHGQTIRIHGYPDYYFVYYLLLFVIVLLLLLLLLFCLLFYIITYQKKKKKDYSNASEIRCTTCTLLSVHFEHPCGGLGKFMVCACHRFTLKGLKEQVMFFPCTEYEMFKLN